MQTLFRDLVGPPLAASTATNVSELLSIQARERGDQDAVRVVHGGTISYAELDRRASGLAGALAKEGLARGDRVSLFVRPGIELVLVTHALLRLGAVPVLIDPGMGKASLLDCIKRVEPRALIGVGKAQLARVLHARAFRSVELFVTVGRRFGWSGPTLDELEARAPKSFETLEPSPNDTAAILFTSGSTGPPKGVVYTHGIFTAQTHALAELYGLAPGDVDLACFPLFALFDHALGLTSVFAPLDPSAPATCDPQAIVLAANQHRATFSFGSPAIWKRILPYLERGDRRFETLRTVTIAGAPVPPELTTRLARRLAENGDVHTPYGATEALPVASFSASETTPEIVARIDAGEGTCVGRLAPGMRARILPIDDEPQPALADGLGPGVVGELAVTGPVVTPNYLFDEDATAQAKSFDVDGRLWHRMGDLCRIDDDDRLWFLGRKSHRLETPHGLLPPVGVENVFNALDEVARTALVGVGKPGKEKPVLIVEPAPGVAAKVAIKAAEALAAARADDGTLPKLHATLAKSEFPVDVRHNAKIHRLELKAWAEKRVR